MFTSNSSKSSFCAKVISIYLQLCSLARIFPSVNIRRIEINQQYLKFKHFFSESAFIWPTLKTQRFFKVLPSLGTCVFPMSSLVEIRNIGEPTLYLFRIWRINWATEKRERLSSKEYTKRKASASRGIYLCN